MSASAVAVRDLLEAGAHYGHLTRLLNPKARPFVFGQRNGISIIDLQKTVNYVRKADSFVESITASGGHILFVGTKRQARELVKEEASRSGQYYMNHRWLGGTLTNYPTLKKSIHKLRKLEKMASDGTYEKLTKKEALNLDRLRLKLDANLAGIKDMPGKPGAIFLTDIIKEKTALLEALKLDIPIVAIVDTNADPAHIDYPMPGNDDSLKSLKLFVSTIADAAARGVSKYAATPSSSQKKSDRSAPKGRRSARSGRSSSSSFQNKEGRTVKVEKVARDSDQAAKNTNPTGSKTATKEATSKAASKSIKSTSTDHKSP